jgi:hypothetical protein
MHQRTGRVRVAAAVFGVVIVGLAFVLDASARIPNPVRPKRAPHAAQVAELRAIRALLERADRDYDGHRVKAIKHITAAIHDLQPRVGKGPGGGQKGGQKGGGEPQKLSDEQLRQAIRDLTVVENQVARDAGPGAVRAVTAIQQAIKELEIALTIR